MPKKTYARKDPAAYAAQRLALGVRVRDGMAVRAAARFLKIPYSTAWLWVAQDGLRQGDLAAEEAGAPRPPIGAWAKPGRGRKAPETEAGLLPPADYPELKGLSGSDRLTKLHGLALTARMRAVAAIEEGCIDYALGALREADKLSRAWRALGDWMERYPDMEAPEEDPDDWRMHIAREIAQIEARERGEELPPEPPSPPREKTPEELLEDEARAAVAAAREEEIAREGPLSEEEWAKVMIEDAVLARQIAWGRAKWFALPGRTPPPIRVQLPPRRRW